MDFKYYIRKTADVRLKDVLAVFPMLLAFVLTPLFRKKYSTTWAVCERKDEARDNGFHFFKYVRREHPEQPCIYAIDRNCRDYLKIRDLGQTVQFGSIKHWILYFSSEYLISSQAFHPNNYVATLIERAGLFRPSHVFLQHGITINRASFLLPSHRTVKYFVAGAKPEFEYMRDTFGYPEGTMQYTGFARFDSLHSFNVLKNRVLVMPTWRKWLTQKSEEHQGLTNDIATSEYYICWSSFLKSERLSKLIEKENLEIVFYPHPNFRQFLDISTMVDQRIRIADPEKEDLQELLKSSSLLVTDYSSVFFDMVYMKKPVLFFQFDEEKYRKYHYKKGWFDYHTSPFGICCDNTDSLVKALKKEIESGFSVSQEYLQEHDRVFELFDDENCKRIYEMLKETDISKKNLERQ